MLLAWTIVFFLILVTALYVAAEFAAVSVRKSQIAELAAGGNRLARRLMPRVENSATLDNYIAACQIGITWSSLVLGAYSQATLGVAYAQLLEQWGGLDPLTAFSWASGAVLFLITMLQMVMGELVPKSLALQFPTRTALATVIPMELSLKLYSWFLVFLNGSGHAILKIFGISNAGHQHIHSPEEIEFLISESRKGGVLDLDEDQRLRRALRLALRPVREPMIPRRLMVAIDVDTPPHNVIKLLVEQSYTRVPVYRRSPDNIIGVLHTRDYVSAVAGSADLPQLRDVLRPIVTVTESTSAGQLLEMLRKQRTHQALVVGELGVKGLVTFGDVLAELMGGITGKGRFGQPPASKLPDGRVRLPGLMRVEDAAEVLGTPLRVNAATVAGLLLNCAGHLPKPGEKIQFQNIEFEVERVDHQAITAVLARTLPQESVR